MRARADDGASAVPAVLAALDAEGLGVTSITVSRPSLDDVYLRYTGRAFGGGEGQAPEMERRRTDHDRRSHPHPLHMALRHLRNLARQPWYIGFTLAQPDLPAALRRTVPERRRYRGLRVRLVHRLPHAGHRHPDRPVLGGWSGGSVIEDLDRGVMDRFLVSPASQVALIAGR
jgi:hypothetical protein